MATMSGEYNAAAAAIAAQLNPLLAASVSAGPFSSPSHSEDSLDKGVDLRSSAALSMDSDADSDIRGVDEESHRKRGNAKRIDAPRTTGSAI